MRGWCSWINMHRHIFIPIHWSDTRLLLSEECEPKRDIGLKLETDLVMLTHNNSRIAAAEIEWYHFKIINANAVARWTFINLICFNGIFPLRAANIIHKKCCSHCHFHHRKHNHWLYFSILTNIQMLIFCCAVGIWIWWWNAHWWPESFAHSKEKAKCG